MSLWPVIRDLFIRKAAEVVIEEVVETAQEALSNRDKDKKESNKQVLSRTLSRTRLFGIRTSNPKGNVMIDEKRNATRLSNRAGTIGERVAVLESKMDSTEQDMRELKELVTTNFKELKEAIEQIRVRKNPVMEFVEDNWKMLVVVAAVFLGKDVTALVQWMKAFGG